MRYDPRQHKKVNFDDEIGGIIRDAVADGIHNTDEPAIDKAVESWSESSGFDSMIEKIRDAVALHINSGVEDNQQNIVDSVID